MFYQFQQNPTTGGFKGHAIIVIEANTLDEAITKAENKTEVYYDGVEKGKDEIGFWNGDRWNKKPEEFYSKDELLLDLNEAKEIFKNQKILVVFQNNVTLEM